MKALEQSFDQMLHLVSVRVIRTFVEESGINRSWDKLGRVSENTID